MSMSSENREIKPKAFESEVPPLNKRRGPPGGRPLKSASRTQHTQKSFSMFCSVVPRRVDVARNRSLRSAGVAEMTWRKSLFMAFQGDAGGHCRRAEPGGPRSG